MVATTLCAYMYILLLAAIIPVVMAGVIGIYGFIIAVVVGTKSKRFDHAGCMF
jgi:hypothetical protein